MTKKFLFGLLSGIIILGLSSQTLSVFAQGTQLEIIPQENLPTKTGNNGEIINAHDRIIDGEGGRHVRENYNKEAKELSPSQQIVSGIMTWDTLLDYGAQILVFLSQAGIAVGGLMFIYVGYQYIMSIIGGESPQPALIRNAIIGILVIIFSYAIMRILTRTFLV